MEKHNSELALGVDPIVLGGGNAISPPSVVFPEKKKQISPSKRWSWCLNNYSEQDISSIVPMLEVKCKVAFFSKEIGDSKTPHLQGFASFISKVRPSSLIPKAHWEKAKGSNQENLIYCTKENELFYSKGVPKPIRLITPDFKWEKIILNEIKSEPDDRTIHWFYSREGSVGKTCFCKYLVVKHNAIILGGKASDCQHAIAQFVEMNWDTPELVIINIPRSFNPEFVSYQMFESIKDMLFFSPKYQTAMVCGNPPHMYIFCNFEPDYEKMSVDRWRVYEII